MSQVTRLWMTIEPEFPETKVMLTGSGVGTLLRARFPQVPKRPEGLRLFLQSIAAWYGQSFCAVLDADAPDVWKHPERWARLLEGLDDAQIEVEWRGYSQSFVRDPLKGTVGDFRRAQRLLRHAAVGIK